MGSGQVAEVKEAAESRRGEGAWPHVGSGFLPRRWVPVVWGRWNLLPAGGFGPGDSTSLALSFPQEPGGGPDLVLGGIESFSAFPSPLLLPAATTAPCLPVAGCPPYWRAERCPPPFPNRGTESPQALGGQTGLPPSSHRCLRTAKGPVASEGALSARPGRGTTSR